jgi:uncharacterized phiE125 gp8 family phage protein
VILDKTVTVFATTEPVTVADVKQKTLRLPQNVTLNDAEIEEIVPDARGIIENLTGRYWAPVTVQLTFDAFPSGNRPLKIPFPDLTALTSISYLDESQASQTLTGATLDTVRNHIRYTDGWPYGTDVIVVLTCGPVAAAVPDSIKRAIRLVCADLFENKGAQLPYQTYENKAVELAISGHIWGQGV